MYPVKIKATNFLSFEKIEYCFKTGKPLLIQGKNNFKEDQRSNGSGKSGLQSIIEYCITKTTSRKLRDIALIRRGTDGATVFTSIYCPVRKQELSIKREIPIKGSTTCDITINGEEVKDVSNVADKDNFILNWLAFEVRDDIQNFYIMNKERYSSIFNSSNTKKVALISRLNDFSFIENSIAIVQKKQDDIQSEYNGIESQITKIDGKIEEKQEDISKVKSSEEFEESKKERIKEKQEEIEYNEELIKDKEVSEKSKKKELEEVLTLKKETEKKVSEENEKLKKIKEKYKAKLQGIEKEIESSKKLKEETEEIEGELSGDLKELNASLSNVNKNLMDAVTCPKCSHKFFPGDEESDVKEQEDKKKELEETIHELSVSIDETEEILNSIQEEINKSKGKEKETEKKQSEETKQLRDSIEELQDSSDELNEKESKLTREVNEISRKILVLKEENEELVLSIESIKEEQQDKEFTKEAKKRIKELESERKKKEEELKEIELRLQKNIEWKFNFNRFKMYLSNKVLMIIQNKINSSLKEMKSEFRVKVDGFKQKADGTIKEEITFMVIDNGELVSFNSLSGGERARVDFASISAIQDLINSSHPYGGLDLIWGDETHEGLDDLGVVNVLKSLEPLNKTILLTTHVAVDNLYSNSILVENNGGVSSIKE